MIIPKTWRQTSFHSIVVPIEQVLVYNDRAEITRRISTQLIAGSNEIQVKNVTWSLINDSVRVDGKGDAVIHEVTTKNTKVLIKETDTPNMDDIRPLYTAKKDEVATLKDKETVLSTRVKALDLIAENGSINSQLNEGMTDNIEKFYTFYEGKSDVVRKELREVKASLSKAHEELRSFEAVLGREYVARFSDSQVVVIALESNDGGAVELDLIYQVSKVSWTPSYDLRVDTAAQSIQVSYFGQVQQSTTEDWNNTKIILSTAKPQLSGTIPKLGTVEVSFVEKQVPHPVHYQHPLRIMETQPQNQRFESAQIRSAPIPPPLRPVERAVAREVKDQVLSNEFTIARRTTIPSGKDKTNVTIGIFEVKTLLVHECAPSKNSSVFLTATAVNESEFQLLQGNANVYLNNSYLAKTTIKNVSPGERFSCSLGVDPAVKVDYKAARKYIEEAGNFNKCASNITQQIIQVRNSRQNEVLLTIHENIPRTTNEKIKIYVLSPHPSSIAGLKTPDNLRETFKTPTEGARLNHEHNLEWTVKIAPGEIKNLEFKWSAEYPRNEKVKFTENTN